MTNKKNTFSEDMFLLKKQTQKTTKIFQEVLYLMKKKSGELNINELHRKERVW